MNAFFVLCALIVLSTLVDAQYMCKGVKNGGVIRQDVIVNGGFCRLHNVVVTGSVRHMHGHLTTTGKTYISGSLTAHGSGSLNLRGQLRVLGMFSVTNFRGSVVIGYNAKLGAVVIGNTHRLIVHGSMTSLSVRATKIVRIRGGRILTGGLSVEQGTGNIELCGATIRGGILVVETRGSLIASATRTCRPSSIFGSVAMVKSVGNVFISGGKLTRSDLIVSELKGYVYVGDVQLSDVLISGITGSVEFVRVRTDSDASISGNGGPVTIRQSSVNGDMRVTTNRGSVTIKNTNFNNDAVSVNGNYGTVTVHKNKRLSITINENRRNVYFTGNIGAIASLSNNHRLVYVRGNTLLRLSCVDNYGRVVSGVPGKRTNIVRGPRTGQCWNF